MNEILVSLKQDLKQILDVIVDKNDVLYFDYPLHLNVGDLLIYAGTEAFFQDYQIHIRLRRCLQSFDLDEVKKYVKPTTTLVCHGGGNFGDLYPAIQAMREALVQAFPNNRIIVMPQTAYFSHPQAKEKSAAIFSAHKDCYLFARDQATYQLMKAQFSDKVFLSPDMAHQLYGSTLLQKQRAVQKSAEKTLYFLRKDIEASHLEKNIQATLPTSAEIKDWEDILTTQDKYYERICSGLAKIANKYHQPWLKNVVNNLWYRHSLAVIERCKEIFQGYDLVVTSRLHGHIFSCLLELPNEVCDNSYGKNLGYYHQWTQDIDFVKVYEE
ncbi:polysaccharide pyruvyl transferase family protein [Avibacterium sp. 20-15]|uniref:polysaccharide pyruvyl transferase family protein n=1 Tax=unclassified Avibacterium TaxID=2685287 RepID=UPI0020267EC7|nr:MULTISPECIES: polysaccharide pyruvyl transferase family protein [unclassified Avibacterium]MCW9732133.1 polysaccharide pyruvyl transferase family protein [Avibacterium sp. 20-15]URL04310.1 polysaccharide pyruvyl transferase family protein [Avibacterium sp. 20-132]